jgi:hypothetical protein
MRSSVGSSSAVVACVGRRRQRASPFRIDCTDRRRLRDAVAPCLPSRVLTPRPPTCPARRAPSRGSQGPAAVGNHAILLAWHLAPPAGSVQETDAANQADSSDFSCHQGFRVQLHFLFLKASLNCASPHFVPRHDEPTRACDWSERTIGGSWRSPFCTEVACRSG